MVDTDRNEGLNELQSRQNNEGGAQCGFARGRKTISFGVRGLSQSLAVRSCVFRRGMHNTGAAKFVLSVCMVRVIEGRQEPNKPRQSQPRHSSDWLAVVNVWNIDNYHTFGQNEECVRHS